MEVLFIEFLFSALLGAVLFRLTWAITKNIRITWLLSLLIAIGLWLFVPASINADIAHEIGKSLPDMPCSFCFELNRFLGWWVGVAIAALVVAKRRKMGLENDLPSYKDFP